MHRRIIGPRELPEREGARFSGTNYEAEAETAEVRLDNYMNALLKLFPAEAVAVFTLVDGIIRNRGVINPIFDWFLFILILVGTIGYLKGIDTKIRIRQISLSVVAFALWVFAIGGPFQRTFDWYDPIYGSLLVPVYLFLIPCLRNRLF